jgi:hypothetical protein
VRAAARTAAALAGRHWSEPVRSARIQAGNYTFEFDTSVWGWVHLLTGILLVVTGYGLFARSTWAGVTALLLAMLNAVVNFLFIPYYPLWSLLLIALNVWVILALTRPQAIKT